MINEELIQFISNIKKCKSCEKNMKLSFSTSNTGVSIRNSIYIENNCIFFNQKDLLGKDLINATINKDNNSNFVISYYDKFYPFREDFHIMIGGICDSCNQYSFQKNIVLNQKTRDILKFGLYSELFTNEDFTINHDYLNNKSTIVKTEKKIELELSSRITLKNLEFDRLKKTVLLLK